MGIIIAAVVLTVIGFIGSIIGINYYNTYNDYGTEGRPKGLSKLLSLFSLAFLLIIVPFMFTTIEANHVGVVYDPLNGGLQNETLGEGLKSKTPFERIIKISTTNQTAFLEVNAQTKDSIYALYEITITYRVNVENAGKFYKVSGEATLSEEKLNTSIKEAIQGVSTKHDIFNIMGDGLEGVREETFAHLKTILEERYFLTLVSLSIDDVDGGDRIESIIQEKAEAIQKIQIAEQDREKAEIEAKTLLIKAENEATITLLKANASAEAQAILNSVTVSAINNMYLQQFETDQEKVDFELNGTGGFLTIQEVSDIVIKQLYYDIWDGKLPTVVGGENGLSLILPQIN